MQNIQHKKPIRTQVKVIEKTPINHDSYIYKLKFTGESFDLKIGEHFRIVETIKTWECPQGEQVVHKYTPISPCSQQDTMDVLFKIYRANVHAKFPHGGKLTTWIESQSVGDLITVEGPYGEFNYQPHGVITTSDFKTVAKRIFFIAGGTGITPCYQIINEIVKMKEEDIELIFLFANKEEQDILLRKELEELRPRLKLHYILDKGDQNWKGLTGYVTKEILEQICPLDDPETLYVHCGPRQMNELIKKIFDQNYPNSKRLKY